MAKLLISYKADVDHQNDVTKSEGWEVAHMVVGADACIFEFKFMRSALVCCELKPTARHALTDQPTIPHMFYTKPRMQA